MAAFTYFSDDYLLPISLERPCGEDLRYTPLFRDIAEGRRSDDGLDPGAWVTEEGQKRAQWDRVVELCTGALHERTKDLRISMYLTEAAVHLDGFSGFRDGIRLTTELIRRFWDQGLYPEIEDQDVEYRAGPLIWINEQMPVPLSRVLITARTGGENYGYVHYRQALEVGTEASIARLDPKKRETVDGYIRQGWIRMEQFDAALRDTSRKALETIVEPFEEAQTALLELEKVADERFGNAAPGFSSVKETFSGIRQILLPARKRKHEEEQGQRKVAPPPDGIKEQPGQPGSPPAVQPVLTAVEGPQQPGDGKDWQEAESLVRAGKLDLGLAQMAALAARETTGRGRFLRKLMLSEVCLNNGRDRMARTLLEELNALINEFKLDRWESSQLVGPVWSRLYKLYRKSEDTSDQERSRELYNRLCSLDPWQAYINFED